MNARMVIASAECRRTTGEIRCAATKEKMEKIKVVAGATQTTFVVMGSAWVESTEVLNPRGERVAENHQMLFVPSTRKKAERCAATTLSAVGNGTNKYAPPHDPTDGTCIQATKPWPHRPRCDTKYKKKMKVKKDGSTSSLLQSNERRKL